jgi:hypothetical protein
MIMIIGYKTEKRNTDCRKRLIIAEIASGGDKSR